MVEKLAYLCLLAIGFEDTSSADDVLSGTFEDDLLPIGEIVGKIDIISDSLTKRAGDYVVVDLLPRWVACWHRHGFLCLLCLFGLYVACKYYCTSLS